MKKYGKTRQATGDIMGRMRIRCWILEATNAYPEYATYCFLRHQWLHERASKLHCAYIVCLNFLHYFTKQTGVAVEIWNSVNRFRVRITVRSSTKIFRLFVIFLGTCGIILSYNLRPPSQPVASRHSQSYCLFET
jgi:hypothetical protein